MSGTVSDRRIAQRQPELVQHGKAYTAARSAAYALFSRLVTSPHDLSSEGDGLPPSDIGAVLHEMEESLPYSIDFSSLAAVASVLTEADGPRLARAYSALFEVGSEGRR